MNTYIIIDDEPIAHEIIEEYCNMLPHLKLEKNCYNAKEAILFLNENTIDFMFLDINMPNMDGWEFIEEYMSTPTLEPLNIIMLSTSTSIKDKNKAKEYEMVKDFMTKPLHIQRLKELVGKIN